MAARLLLSDVRATESFAASLAPLLRIGDALLLSGDLGAGKSTFARALLQALGVQGDIPSPTFTLVQHYDLPELSVAHFDLYRLKRAEEIEEIGFHDALADGAVLVEWPERADVFMPAGALGLHFTCDETGTHAVIVKASGQWTERLETMLDANAG